MNILVVGASGVVGSAAAEHLSGAGFEVTTLSRRPAFDAPGTGRDRPKHVQADLLESRSFPAGVLAGITHVVYAGYTERPGTTETTDLNERMLRGLMEVIERDRAPVQHFVLIGGGKSYGEHLGPYRTPAKESDPRLLGPILYNPLEDLVQDRALRFGGAWTVLRPDGIIGHRIGSPMNILAGIAAFAILSKEQGVPLRFPGSLHAWRALHQATDARVLSRSIEWALDAESARNEIFNVTNGDNFRWCHVWPDIADFFSMPVGDPQPLDLVEHMSGASGRWRTIAQRDGLNEVSLAAFAQWPFVHGWLNTGYDMVQSTVKIRRAGFSDAIDTHQSMREQLAQLRHDSFIP